MVFRSAWLAVVVGLLAASPSLAAIYTYTGIFNAGFDLTVDITLDSAVPSMDLTLTGPADRWFAVGFSLEGNMAGSEALVYSNLGFEQRGLPGYGAGYLTDPQPTLIDNNVIGNVRTLTIEDWQMTIYPYTDWLADPLTYNPMTMVWAIGIDMTFAHHIYTGAVPATFEVPEPTTAISLAPIAAAALLRRRHI